MYLRRKSRGGRKGEAHHKAGGAKAMVEPKRLRADTLRSADQDKKTHGQGHILR